MLSAVTSKGTMRHQFALSQRSAGSALLLGILVMDFSYPSTVIAGELGTAGHFCTDHPTGYLLQM